MLDGLSNYNQATRLCLQFQSGLPNAQAIRFQITPAVTDPTKANPR
jgi:hypothetical protein